jgi:hypothetical protein
VPVTLLLMGSGEAVVAEYLVAKDWMWVGVEGATDKMRRLGVGA